MLSHNAALLFFPLLISLTYSLPTPTATEQSVHSIQQTAPLTIEITTQSTTEQAKQIAQKIWRDFVIGYHNIINGRVMDTVMVKRMSAMSTPNKQPADGEKLQSDDEISVMKQDDTHWLVVSTSTFVWFVVLSIFFLCCCCCCSSCFCRSG